MEDLRVLEQQQRESQHLLTSIKLTKKHKVEQFSQAEQQLAAAKYANGENRAMLTRYRQILSQKTREMGSLKIRRANGSTDLKRLDVKLRKALATAERLRIYRRKIDATVLALSNTVSIQEKKKHKISLDMRNAGMKRDDARHREQLLVKSITEFRSKSNALSEEILRTRQGVSAYETDLANAKQMETSTKYRVNSIKAEIKSEDKRHQEVMAEIQNEVENTKYRESDTRSKLNEIKTTTQSVQSQLEIEIEKTKSFQSEDDMAPDGPPFNIDIIRDRCEAEENRLAKEKLALYDREVKVEELNNEIEQKRIMESELRIKSAHYMTEIQSRRESETKRREEHKELAKLLEIERIEVEKVCYYMFLQTFKDKSNILSIQS